ncbi:MAG: nucleotide exchange factor GrpE [Oscillospiraceae bacterium]|nr:nucleotide exchange factor GrpE [Oscillospiraceae bacterium]
MTKVNNKEENVDQESEDEQTQDVDLKLKETFQSLERELSEQKDIFLRMAAEYENYRKRSERDKIDVYTRAIVDVTKMILPVVDSLKLAVATQNSTAEEYKKGLDLISRQLLSIFDKLKIESFGEKGQKFNPDVHSAISHVDDDSFEENCIVEVFQEGYRLKDKIIRHAVVKTAN